MREVMSYEIGRYNAEEMECWLMKRKSCFDY